MELQHPASGTASQELLAYLGLVPEAPSLDYLNRLVREHQLRVPFETLTKLVDYEGGLESGNFLPPLDIYVDRIVHRGGGGLCWTLARGFHALLTELGFDAALMVMTPGHCCVRVELGEGPQYADVGYAAPLFRAYPLFESFSLETHREAFEYRVRSEGIFVSRKPGPSKQLDPTPRPTCWPVFSVWTLTSIARPRQFERGTVGPRVDATQSAGRGQRHIRPAPIATATPGCARAPSARCRTHAPRSQPPAAACVPQESRPWSTTLRDPNRSSDLRDC